MNPRLVTGALLLVMVCVFADGAAVVPQNNADGPYPPLPRPAGLVSQYRDLTPAEARELLLDPVTDLDALPILPVRRAKEEADELLRELHRRWKNGGERGARAMKVFILFIRDSNFYYGREPELAKLRNEMLFDQLEGDADARRRMLHALQFSRGIIREDHTKPRVLELFRAAREEDQALWGRVVVRLAVPDDLKEYLWSCIRAAYFDAVNREQTGEADINAVPGFGAGAENQESRFRGWVIRSISIGYCEPAAEFLTEVLKRETNGGVLDAAEQAIRKITVDSPAGVEALKVALDHDRACLRWCVLKRAQVRPNLVEPLRERIEPLTKSFRSRLREAAIKVLGLDADDAPEPEPYVLDEQTAKELLSLAPFDITKARRVEAKVLAQSAWGGSEWSDEVTPGWLFDTDEEDRYVFYSDGLDYSSGSAERLDFEVLDFDAEVEEMLARLEDQPGSGNDEHFPPGLGVRWIIGSEEHDWLRTLYVAQLEAAGDEPGFPKTSRLLANILAGFSSERDFLERLAYELVWLRFSGAVHAHGNFHDDIAREHAAAIEKYRPWTRPQTDFDGWLRDAARILEDLEARKGSYVTRDEDTPEYWVERLPDVVIRQFSQPGGADWSFDEDEDEVHDKIVSFGMKAVPALLDALDTEDRLIRGCEFWRDFHKSRSIFTTGEAASWILREIAEKDLNVEIDPQLLDKRFRPEFRAWFEEVVQIRGD